MKKLFVFLMVAISIASCGNKTQQEKSNLFTPSEQEFDYVVDKFADLQILRYRVSGIETLSLKQQELLYYLSEAALCGRDILFDQNGKYNLAIRQLLENVYVSSNDKESDDFNLKEYGCLTVFITTIQEKNLSLNFHKNGSNLKLENCL